MTFDPDKFDINKKIGSVAEQDEEEKVGFDPDAFDPDKEIGSLEQPTEEIAEPKVDLVEEVAEGYEQPSKSEAFVRGAAQGLTFGFSDEITSGFMAALAKRQKGESFSDAYKRHLQESRKEYKEAEQAHSGTYLAGEVAGGVAPALATGGGTLVASGLRTAGKLGAKELAKQVGKKVAEKGVSGAITKGAATGAAYGGLYGAGVSEADVLTEGEVGELAKDVVSGGVTGAVGGAALGAIGKYTKPVRDKISQMTNKALDSIADVSTSSKNLVNTARATLNDPEFKLKLSKLSGKPEKLTQEKINYTQRLTDDIYRLQENTVQEVGKVGQALSGLRKASTKISDDGLIDEIQKVAKKGHEATKAVEGMPASDFNKFYGDLFRKARNIKKTEGYNAESFHKIQQGIKSIRDNLRKQGIGDDELERTLDNFIRQSDDKILESIGPKQTVYNNLKKRYGDYKDAFKVLNEQINVTADGMLDSVPQKKIRTKLTDFFTKVVSGDATVEPKLFDEFKTFMKKAGLTPELEKSLNKLMDSADKLGRLKYIMGQDLQSDSLIRGIFGTIMKVGTRGAHYGIRGAQAANKLGKKTIGQIVKHGDMAEKKLLEKAARQKTPELQNFYRNLAKIPSAEGRKAMLFVAVQNPRIRDSVEED